MATRDHQRKSAGNTEGSERWDKWGHSEPRDAKAVKGSKAKGYAETEWNRHNRGPSGLQH